MQPQDIVDHWPLHTVTFGPSYQSYPTRRVVRLHSDRGELVAKVDADPPSPETTRRALSVFDYLARRGFEHVPRLLRARSGAAFVDLPDGRVTLMEFVAGERLDPAAPAGWRELGGVAARLNSFADYAHPFAIPVRAALSELAALAPRYSFAAQYRAILARLEPLAHSRRRGLIHGEINPANCVRQAGGRLVLLDWDEAGSGPLVLEQGYPLLTVFLSEELRFHRAAAAAFYAGYAGDGHFDEPARQRVFDAALFHALRYMHYADTERRWRRILYAIEHRAELLAALP